MPLELKQLREEITKGRNAQSLVAAKLHQQRIKFHTEKRITTFNNSCICVQSTDFLNWVQNLLPHDKFIFFKSLFRYPVKTNEVTGICFDKLFRVFDGRNPVDESQFINSEYKADWEDYRLNVLKEPEVWKTTGWEFFKTEINSVLVVDLAPEQKTEFPEPYFYWLSIDRIIAYIANPDTGVMDWIAFRDKDRIIVIDDYSYRVWNDEKHTGMPNGEPLFENPHGLGYCPARFFWNEAISINQPDVKCSPLTDQLESLDWYLFYHISKRNLDMHGAYPIFSGYEQSCDFSNDETGDYCDGGFLKDKKGHYKLDSAGVLMRCPKCGNKRIVGPGSFVEIPVPNEEQNQPDLRNPVQILKVDRDSLDYNVEECQRLRSDIITAVCGQDEVITNREAFNEQQIRANYEDKTTILNRIKKGFEDAQMWVDRTVCLLRYGNYFISNYIDLGTEFYLDSVDDLREQYKTAKESGASESELDMMQKNIIDTQYRNNPLMRRRMELLKELEPYPHMTLQEMRDASTVIRDVDLLIKINFANFVRRFERENINILEFGSEIPMDKKVATIRAEFERYATEIMPEQNGDSGKIGY